MSSDSNKNDRVCWFQVLDCDGQIQKSNSHNFSRTLYGWSPIFARKFFPENEMAAQRELPLYLALTVRRNFGSR